MYRCSRSIALVGLLTLALLLGGCGGNSEEFRVIEEATPTMAVAALSHVPPTATPPPPTATPLPTATLPPVPTDTPEPIAELMTHSRSALASVAQPALQLGDQVRVEKGGFAFEPIPGYAVTLSDKVVRMSHPAAEGEANLAQAPDFLLIGSRLAQGDSAANTVNAFATSTVGQRYKLSAPVAVSVNGIDGYAVDFGGQVQDQLILGRIVVLETNGQGFILFAGAPAEQWQSQVVQLFDTVLHSVTFFTPTG